MQQQAIELHKLEVQSRAATTLSKIIQEDRIKVIVLLESVDVIDIMKIIPSIQAKSIISITEELLVQWQQVMISSFVNQIKNPVQIRQEHKDLSKYPDMAPG